MITKVMTKQLQYENDNPDNHDSDDEIGYYVW